MEENIYFISGHLNLSRGEFQKHYEDKILEAMKLNCKFVTSDSRGCDTYAQELFANHNYTNVVIYHMFDSPRVNIGNFATVGSSKTDEERDSKMTTNSTHDIAWIRPEEETRRLVESEGKKYRPGRISGTEKNLLRRNK